MADVKPIGVSDICALLRAATRAAIFSHTRPDADTLSSAFALRAMLLRMGKEAVCICDGEIPRSLDFLLGSGDLHCEIPDGTDLVISVDVASPGQLGIYAPLADRFDAMIDHHATGEPFAPYFLDGGAAAAAELVYQVYDALRRAGDIPEMPDVCRLLYAGLVDDTGNLKYSNVTPETFRTAAALLAEIKSSRGLTVADISRNLFDAHPLSILRGNALVTRKLRLAKEGRLAVATVTLADLAGEGLCEADLADGADIPRAVRGTEIGVVLKQQLSDPGAYRVSSRSNGDADVAAVCRRFGGGGHVKAAGCTILASSPDEAERIAVEAFGAALGDIK